MDRAWLVQLQQEGIGTIVYVDEEMQIFQEMHLLSRLPEHGVEPHRDLHAIQGHKERHKAVLAFSGNLGIVGQ